MYWIGKPQSAMVDISNLKINFKIQFWNITGYFKFKN